MSMIHEITTGAHRNTKRTRKGRGRASGHGKTAGRGTKGAKARVGKYVKRGHEHGQTPIFRRFPKRGFSNFKFARRFNIVNVADLERFEDGATVDAAALHEAGLVPAKDEPVKILGNGNLSRRLTVQAGHFSKSALEKIAQAGGVAQDSRGEPFVLPSEKKKGAAKGKAKADKAAKAEAAAE